MNLTTFTSRTSAAVVAGVAGYSSYQHITDVATHAGEHRGVALVLPLAIDGLIVVGTMAMIEDKRAGRLPRQSARFALAFGIIATLAANIASAEPAWTARMVAAVPAISFLIAVEVLARVGKPRPAVTPEPAPVAAPPAAPLAEVASAEPGVDAKPAVTRARPRSLTSEQKVAKAAAKLRGGTVAQIAAKAGVSESTARRYLPADLASPSGPDAAETPINEHRPDALAEVSA